MPIEELLQYALSSRRYDEELAEEISNYGIVELLKYVDYSEALLVLERAQESLLRVANQRATFGNLHGDL